MKEIDPTVAREQRHRDLEQLKRLYVDEPRSKVPEVIEEHHMTRQINPDDYGKYIPTAPRSTAPLAENWGAPPPPHPPWPAPEVHRDRPVEVTEGKITPDWSLWAFLAGTFGLLLGITMPAMNWALPLIPSAAGVGLGIYALRHPNARKGFAIAGLVTGLLGLLCTWGLFRMYSDAMDALDKFDQKVENLDG